MGFRSTGAFHPAEEILVLTCDVCERDIGYEDGRRPRAHLSVARHPNAGGFNDQDAPASVCSRQCLAAYAEKLSGLDRESGSPKSGGSSTRRKKGSA
jgi:hypothetical protein